MTWQFGLALGAMVGGACWLLYRQWRDGALLDAQEREAFLEHRRRAHEGRTVRKYPCLEAPCEERLTATEMVRWAGRCGFHNALRALEEQRRAGR